MMVAEQRQETCERADSYCNSCAFVPPEGCSKTKITAFVVVAQQHFAFCVHCLSNCLLDANALISAEPVFTHQDFS